MDFQQPQLLNWIAHLTVSKNNGIRYCRSILFYKQNTREVTLSIVGRSVTSSGLEKRIFPFKTLLLEKYYTLYRSWNAEFSSMMKRE